MGQCRWFRNLPELHREKVIIHAKQRVYFRSVGIVSASLSLHPLLLPASVGQGPTYSELLTLGKACEVPVTRAMIFFREDIKDIRARAMP